MISFLLQRLMSRNSMRSFTLSVNWSPSKMYTNVRTFSIKETKESSEAKDWITIYKFPYIVAAARVAKIRQFQYIVTCVAPLVTYGFEHYELVSEYSTLCALSLSVSLSITLTLCGIMFRRLIGFLYVDPTREYLKIGFLTFSGRREDKVLKIQDIKTLSMTQKSKYQPFRTVTSYTDNTKYKLIDLGGIIKRDDYELVFGRD